MSENTMASTLENEESQMGIREFIALHSITMDYELKDEEILRSKYYGRENVVTRRHWKVVLRYTSHSSSGQKHRHQMTIPEYFAPTETPDIADILDCISSEASMFDSACDYAEHRNKQAGRTVTTPLSEWIAEYGSGDGIEVDSVFKSVKRQTAKLKRFLGEVNYSILLYEVEKL